MVVRAALSAFACLLVILGTPAYAQDSDGDAASREDAAEDSSADDALLGKNELETLVAPIALYPDTLLVQVLVASTAPLDVIKADRLVDDNADAEPDILQAAIDEEDWDESVGVLAAAFPDVLSDMADHVEWTETMGTAMLAQSDDVLAAIQTLRQDAIETGALESGDEQTIEVAEDKNVVIQPTDPQVVYVPQYTPQQVFPATYAASDPDFYNNWDVGDALAAGAIAWGTYSLIDEIFDDDDDWHGYWGCRNCGGWDGAPIIRNPDIDIDVDGNVNLGNRVDIDRDQIKADIDRDKIKGEWNPDSERRQDARDKIKQERNAKGDSKLHLDKSKSRGDKVRENISSGGDRDLAAAVQRPPRPGSGGGDNRPNLDRPGGGALAGLNLPGEGGNRPSIRPVDRPKPKIDRAASNRPKTGASNAIRGNAGPGVKANIKKAGGAKHTVKKPATRPAAIKKPVVKRQSPSRPALQKSHSAKVTRASSKRGHASRGHAHHGGGRHRR